MGEKIILFELNEVPLRIIHHFCRLHPKSVLARRLPECYQYETFAEDQGELSPWITWPTLHRGVPNGRHCIGSFGQPLKEVDDEFPPLWKRLASHGVKTGVCGSLHSYPMPDQLDNYAFYLPDTFAAGSECFPKSISLFQQFNLEMARESARNVSMRVPWKPALMLLASAPGLGFKLETMADLGRQLVSERIQPWQRVRRRTYQSILAFDVFMKYLEQTKPDFATFFTNHVASSMHRYWAAAFPEDYDHVDFSHDWIDTYRYEIDFTMKKFDALFGRLMRFVDNNPEYQLWVASSMGQAATIAEPTESQLYCVDVKGFMSTMAVEPEEWTQRPAMLPQCNVVVHKSKVAPFRNKLTALCIDGRPLVFRECEDGFFSMDFGHAGLDKKPPYAILSGRQIPFAELGLKVIEIEDKSSSTAYHIPNGSLLIYNPRDRRQKMGHTQISTLEIAPTLLHNFSVPAPSYMKSHVNLAVQ